MCGIIGISGNLDEKDLQWLNSACSYLNHRGPDSSGIWVGQKKNIAFGHSRLSIIDTSNLNDQPFVSNDGKLVIVFNGEIYNYIEIRNELTSCGFKFRTNGDTEVLLAAYQHWGEDCLQHLNGMWAFAIYDQSKGTGFEKLFVARDRAGEKPFYYNYNLGCFQFASELKALRLSGEIDLNALNHYLALGYIPGELCIALGVKKLPPAHAGIYNFETRKFSKWRYWKLPPSRAHDDNNLNIEDLAEESWSLLKDSIKLRLRSDVPAGIFLSGGLDSSLITAAASEVSKHPVKTFTVGIPGSSLDETKHAHLISNAFNTDHHVLKIDEPSLDYLNELRPFIDEPIADSSIIPTFMISRLTRKYVTVALGGDGGDELFGGYNHYQSALRQQAYLGWLPSSLFKLISEFASILPAGTKGRNYLTSLKKGPLQSSIWGSPYFDVHLRKKLFTPSAIEQLGDDINLPEIKSLFLYNEGIDPIDKLTRLDFQQVLPDDFLVKVDRASMANSLEVRTPFLDYRLIENNFRKISSMQKVNLSERRILQNLMAKKHLPKNFEFNRKQGFSIPIDQWMKNISFKDVSSIAQRKFFNEKFIKELISGQSQKKTNGSRLFSLIMLNLMEN